VGLAVVSDLLNNILFYIPNVFVALVVVLIGFYIAKLLSASVKVFAVNLGITRPDIAAKAVNYLVLFFVFVVVLEQLGISKEIVTSAFSIALGAIGLGAAIAIGLGSKDIVADWWKKSRLKKKE
jgi:small-conductance mechanosensitive channel